MAIALPPSGVSVLAGVAVLFLIVPLNSYLSNRMKSLLFAALKFRDQRVKMVSEIISGIKVSVCNVF